MDDFADFELEVDEPPFLIVSPKSGKEVLLYRFGDKTLKITWRFLWQACKLRGTIEERKIAYPSPFKGKEMVAEFVNDAALGESWPEMARKYHLR